MNWKLIFGLSLFGIAMALATVFISPINNGQKPFEPICWLLIFLLYAYLIAKNASGKFFLHGFLVSVVNGIFIGSIHALFFAQYIANHTQELEMTANMPMHDHPRKLMVLLGPVFGAGFGLINGLFAFIASKIVKKPA